MTDLEHLQGTWNVVSLEIDGQAMPAPVGARVVVTGDRFESLGMGAVYEGVVELNPAPEPKQFDLVFQAGPESGNRSLGIYELAGDTWKICLTLTGNTRPRGFATTPGSGHALEVLTRGVAAPVEPSPAFEATPTPELEGEWQMTACIANGQVVPASMVKTGRRVTRDGRTEAYFGKNQILSALYAVDKSAQPYRIDYALANGQRQAGIWKFEGETLHICFAAPGQTRPVDFTGAGAGLTLTSWQKVKN